MLDRGDLLPIGLLKFSQEEYIRSFLHDGVLRFNTIGYYQANYENADATGRFDKLEGTDMVAQPKDILKLTIAERDFRVAPDGPPMTFRVSNVMHFTHACCFSVLYNRWQTIDGRRRVFDPAMFRLGNALAVIRDVKGFLSAVHATLKNDRRVLYLQAGIVEYVDLALYSGELGAFKKSKEYKYQQEFRIGLVATSDEPLTISIGPMLEYANLVVEAECKNEVVEDTLVFS